MLARSLPERGFLLLIYFIHKRSAPGEWIVSRLEKSGNYLDGAMREA